MPKRKSVDYKEEDDEKSGSEYCPSDASDVEEELMQERATSRQKMMVMVMDCVEATEPMSYTVPFDMVPKRMQKMMKKSSKDNQTTFSVSIDGDDDNYTDVGLVDCDKEEKIEESVEEVKTFLREAIDAKNASVFPCKHHFLIVTTE